jgi:hypothetical protein
VVWACGLALVSCVAAPSPTPLPTLTLIPATATLTPTPVTPTATRANLPGPADLVTPAPEQTPADTLESDPIAADLASLAQRRVAAQLDLPTSRIRVIDVTPYTWTDTSLGCPLSGQTYQPVDVIGYRIVLEVGDDTYIFHSDTEQLIACAAEDEVLPD